MKTEWTNYFTRSAGVFLAIAGSNRFLIAAGNEPFLALPDPTFNIPLRDALWIAGTIEIFVGLICLFGRTPRFRATWLAWLLTTFFLLKAGMLWTGGASQTTCIGSLSDPLHLSRGITGLVVRLIPPCLLLGSCCVLLWPRLNSIVTSRKPGGEPVKTPCPICGGRVQFDIQNLGQKIPCPHCKTVITLEKSKQLKMFCTLCTGHIEFPAHAVGQKIRCPHCQKMITLLSTS